MDMPPAEFGEPIETNSCGGDTKPNVIDAFFYNDFPGVFAPNVKNTHVVTSEPSASGSAAKKDES